MKRLVDKYIKEMQSLKIELEFYKEKNAIDMVMLTNAKINMVGNFLWDIQHLEYPILMPCHNDINIYLCPKKNKDDMCKGCINYLCV